MPGIGIDTSNVSTTPAAAAKEKSNSSLDKDAFLKLLVAQMQYQDPLEPTSNTEYMSQLAQFSSVEELQNLSTSFANGQAMNLTGQYVILNVPDAVGNVDQISGLVDYVTLSEGKVYLHVNDNYYPADYLDSVVSIDYLEHLINSAEPSDGTDDKNGDNVDGADGKGNGDSDGSDNTETV